MHCNLYAELGPSFLTFKTVLINDEQRVQLHCFPFYQRLGFPRCSLLLRRVRFYWLGSFLVASRRRTGARNRRFVRNSRCRQTRRKSAADAPSFAGVGGVRRRILVLVASRTDGERLSRLLESDTPGEIDTSYFFKRGKGRGVLGRLVQGNRRYVKLLNVVDSSKGERNIVRYCQTKIKKLYNLRLLELKRIMPHYPNNLYTCLDTLLRSVDTFD